MKSIRQVCQVLCWLSLFVSAAAFGQSTTAPSHVPQITIALQTSDELIADMKFLTELAGQPGIRAWKPLKDTLDTFLLGIDPKKPIIAEIKIRSGGSDTIAHFPLPQAETTTAKGFIANLKGFGVNVTRKGGGLSELTNALTGFLRIANGHASITTSTDRNLLPANMPNPLVAAQTLLSKKYDLGLLLKNGKLDSTAIQSRRTDFQKVKDELLAGLKQQPGATAEDFAVDKAIVEHNLNELERFIAESAELLLGWNTDAANKEARLDFELTPIASSSLEESAKLLGQAPSMFSGVPRSKDAILSGRLNFPLDQMRQSNAIGGIALLRARADKRIETSINKTAEQKAATKAAAKQWYDMLEAGANAGLIDAMVEVSQTADQKPNLLFAIKAPDGHALKGILELIPQMNADIKVQLDVEKIGEYSVHRIQVPEKEEDFDLFFGKGAPVFVATGPKAWWLAVGVGAFEQLKTAMTEAAQPNAAMTSNFLTLFYRVRPWIEFLDARRARLDAIPSEVKLTEAQIKDKKDRAAHRKLALEAFKGGKDTIETKLDAKGGKVTGSTRIDEGILRFIGSEIAKFSNETLK